MKSQPRILHGPYHAPQASVGDELKDALYGFMPVGGFSDGLISWPMGSGIRASHFILCGDLIKALQQESDAAISFAWGVGEKVIVGWRRSLGIPEPKTEESPKDISPVKRRQVEKLLLAGLSVASVAETARVTSALVRKIKASL